ncbi:MAG: hypothetical protein IJP66_02840 [Kiritimatiellae bacterium]|nr:hypothetical protein [Kiritimatiellia bacterium]
MKDENQTENGDGHILGKLSAFYFPLAVQSISMTLTYPLVGSVVAHGPLGATEYAIMAQAQAVMFLVGSIGSGLISTGMLFSKSKRGRRNFITLSLSLGLGAIILQALCCVNPLADLIFNRFYHLDAPLMSLARRILFFSIPMNFAFFARNSGLATLFTEKRTDKATFATFFRIALTWAGSVVLVRLGHVGWEWGLGLTTCAVIIETSLVNILARPYARRLPEDDGQNATVARQYAFAIPLALGGTMICISGTVVPVFLSLTPDPEISRNIHYIAFGILNPLSNAAMKIQSVVLAFPPRNYRRGLILAYGLAIGLLWTGVSLLLQIPAIGGWYFGTYQNLDAASVPLAMKALLIIGAIPFVVSIKAFLEGRAALMMRPNAILSCQIAFLAAQVLVFFALIHVAPLPGYLMSGVSTLLAQVVSVIVLNIAIFSNKIADNYGVAHATRHREV